MKRYYGFKLKTEPIIEFMKKNNLTQAQFAKLCGFSVSTLRRMLKTKKLNMSCEILYKLLVTMKVKGADLIDA